MCCIALPRCFVLIGVLTALLCRNGGFRGEVISGTNTGKDRISGSLRAEHDVEEELVFYSDTNSGSPYVPAINGDVISFKQLLDACNIGILDLGLILTVGGGGQWWAVVGGGHLGCILDLGVDVDSFSRVMYPAPCRSACAVCRALLRAHANRMPIAACDAMLCPIHACLVRQLRHHFYFISFILGPVLTYFSAMNHPACDILYLECSLCWMPIGADWC